MRGCGFLDGKGLVFWKNVADMGPDRVSPAYKLTSPLARLSLHATDRDPNRKLMWTNSICILFLLVGVSGSNPARLFIKPLPQTESTIPALVEAVPLPPVEPKVQEEPQEPKETQKTEGPQVVVVTPEAPSINFSVPTIGNLVVPSALATAPPLRPMEPATPLKKPPVSLNSTGAGGERPQPPYPRIALQLGQQGTVLLLLAVDETGRIISIEVKQSSGFSTLDQSALDFVKRHWKLVPGTGARAFEAPIIYRIASE